MMSEELKPCPFCGGKITMTYNADGMASAWCKSCNYHGPERNHSATAKQAWNTRVQPAAERTEEGEDEGEAWEPDEFSDGPYTNLADGRMEPAADIDAPEYGDMQLWYPREEWYPLLCAWRTFAARVSALEAEKGALENQLLGSSDCIKFTQEPQ
jgi:Lar family restriction alleviation protein